jgi:hypothetical protein
VLLSLFSSCSCCAADDNVDSDAKEEVVVTKKIGQNTSGHK